MNIKSIVMVAVLLVGCAGPEAKSPCEVRVIQNPTAAKVQGQMVAGTTWIWNEAGQAYEWVTSDENKARAEKAIKATKDTVSELYSEAVKAYNDRK